MHGKYNINLQCAGLKSYNVHIEGYVICHIGGLGGGLSHRSLWYGGMSHRRVWYGMVVCHIGGYGMVVCH